MNESIKIVAAKRTCKGWKEDEYDIKIEKTFDKVNIRDGKDGFDVKSQPYGNNIEIRILLHDDKGVWILSDKDHYTKELITKIVNRINKYWSIPTKLVFDENAWTDSKAWNIDLSKQITVKVLRPIGMQIMGSTIVEGKVFATIKNIPPKYPVDYGYVEYPKGKVCENVTELVHALFREIDILGADAKIDGKTLSYNEAKQLKPRNIKLIEIFL